MSDPSSDQEDLKVLWQAQPQESDPMTLEHIQAISRRLDRQTQLRMLLLFLMVGFGFFVSGQGLQKAHEPLSQAMYVLLAAGIVGSAYVGYRVGNLRRDTIEPGGTFLRRRLEHALSLRRGRGPLLVVLPMAPAIAAMGAVLIREAAYARHVEHLTPAQVALNFLPIVIVAAAWAVVLLIIRPQAMRRLRKDIADLDAAMK